MDEQHDSTEVLIPQDASPGRRASLAERRSLTSLRALARGEEGYDAHMHFIHRANWLRAAVLGANDGLVSVASLTIGVAGSTKDVRTLLVSTVAALVAGALSMGVGEYISVSSQRDIELADVEKEREAQQRGPASRAMELEELVQIYVDRGLTPELARQVAMQLTEHDVIRTHARDELGIDIDEYTNPWQAAIASMVSFSLGGLVPLGCLLIPGLAPQHRVALIVAAFSVALVVFGMAGAWGGGAPLMKGTTRVVLGGWLAMAITFGVGKLFDAEPA